MTTNTPYNPGMDDRWLLALLAVCLFLTYPLALVCPVRTGVPLAIYFELPTFYWMSLAAGGWLLLEIMRSGGAASVPLYRDRNRLFLVMFLVFFPAVILRSVADRSFDGVVVVETIGMLAIPLFFALRPPGMLLRLLPPLLAVLWLVNAVHGLWQNHVGFEVVGLAGSRNWMASLMIALMPWVWIALAGRSRLPVPTLVALVRRYGVPFMATLLALLLAYKGESRATWLLLAGYVLLFRLIPGLTWKGRTWIALTLAVAGLAVVLMCSDRWQRLTADEIRPPLWKQTVKLIVDHPLTGVGAGNFQRDFVQYKSLEHKRSRVAAAVTEHPHNEPLRLAAEVGIPLTLLWLLLWLPLWTGPGTDTYSRALHFGAWMLCGHGLLDKTLVQQPTALLGLLFLGLLWNSRLPDSVRKSRTVPRWLTASIVAVFLLAGLTLGGTSALSAWYLRAGQVAEDARMPQTAYEDYCRAAVWNPHMVEAQLRAGIAAMNLNRPQDALPHFAAVIDLAPEYAHVNGEIGAALAMLGRHAEALPYFQHDVGLFPFDQMPARRLLRSLLDNGRYLEALRLAQRLPDLDLRRVMRSRGAESVAKLAQDFVNAVQEGHEPEALAAAAALASMKEHQWLLEPEFPALCRQSGFPVEFANEPFDSVDYMYWRECFLAKTRQPTIQQEWEALGQAPDGARVLRVRPFDFCPRQQILANILHAQCGSENIPWFGEMPSLRLARLRLFAGDSPDASRLRLELDLDRRKPVK